MNPSLAARQFSSDYVLLDRLDSYSAAVPLPRPPLWFILPLLGLLDAAVTVAFVSSGGIGGYKKSRKAGFAKDELALVAWGLLRAAVVTGACSSTRIREVGWVIVGSGLISALAGLAQLNLLIQNRHWAESIPASSVLFALSHLAFGVLHWLAFVTIVGVSKERNPFGLGLGTSRRSGGYEERVANVAFRRERQEESFFNNEDPLADTTTPNRNARKYSGRRSRGASASWENGLASTRHANEASMLSDEEDGEHGQDGTYEDEEDDDDLPIDRAFPRYADEDHEPDTDSLSDGSADRTPRGESSSEDDPDDIIDIIPSPSTSRRRVVSASHSYRSLRLRNSVHRSLAESPEEDPERGEELAFGRQQDRPSGPPLSRTYGTFRSLAGI